MKMCSAVPIEEWFMQQIYGREIDHCDLAVATFIALFDSSVLLDREKKVQR